MDKKTILDCIDYFKSRGIACRNITEDVVEILVRTSTSGKADCWVQISEEEVYFRAND